KAGGRRRGGDQDEGPQGVARAAFNQGASAGRFGSRVAFGGGAAPATDALFAAAAVEAESGGSAPNTSSADETSALVDSDLAAQQSRAGSPPNTLSPLLLKAELSLGGASNSSD